MFSSVLSATDRPAWAPGTLTLLCAVTVAFAPAAGQDGAAVDAARRVIAMSSLAALEYSEGVTDGRVVSTDEVEEARLFLGEARRAAGGLPSEVATATRARLDSALSVVGGTGLPEVVTRLSRDVAAALDEAFGGLEEPVPSLRPPMTLGSRLFAVNCTECHGDGGMGDGFRAPELDPPPSDLTDAAALADQSPLDHFRKIRYGVSGTEMPAFEDVLDDAETWAVVQYVVSLRGHDETRARGAAVVAALCPECGRDVPDASRLLAAAPSWADPEVAARLSDEALGAHVAASAAEAGLEVDSAHVMAVAEYVRTAPFAEEADDDVAGVFAAVRTEVARAIREARAGAAEAATALVFDAYVTFEEVETEVAVRDPGLAAELERRFVEFRGLVAEPESAHLAAAHEGLLTELAAAQGLLDRPTSPVSLFVQSFVLLLREGLEAVLIVAALTAVVTQSGAGDRRRRSIWLGVGVAILASVLTAVLLESVFRLGVAEQEALEGFTMLAATGVLIFVSYWLLAKVEVNRWKAFVTTQARQAITSGSMLTLSAAAFLAVYREGFETVLFYKALFITAEGQGGGAIGLGAVAGALCLAVVYAGISYARFRVPMRAFFAVTSAILFYMAFSFAGKGIAELQESQLIATTLLQWAPSVPWMGIYPTAQTLFIQGCVLALLVFGVLWTFVMQPQRAAASVR